MREGSFTLTHDSASASGYVVLCREFALSEIAPKAGAWWASMGGAFGAISDNIRTQPT